MADAEAVRKQRQQQLEEKRRRLEELRKRKKEKQDKAPAARAASPPPGGGGPGDGADFDAYIKSLLNTPAPGASTAAGAEENGTSAADGARGAIEAAAGAPSAGAGVGAGASRYALAEAAARLTVVTGLAEVHVPPKVVELYDKGCQTDAPGLGGGGAGGGGGDGSRAEDGGPATPLSDTKKTPEKAKGHMRVFSRSGAVYDIPEGAEARPPGSAPTLLTTPSPHRGSVAMLWSVEADAGGALPAAPSVRLSAEEKREVASSEDFQGFLQRASVRVERALGEADALDVLVDYGADEGERDRGDLGQRLSKAMQFHEERWCSERAVTDLQWSAQRPELLLASYSPKGQLEPAPPGFGGSQFGSSGDPDGLVLVWSLAMQNRPEYQLMSQSPTLTAKFHPFSGHMVLGGTYSGQVLVWDMRAKSLPVQRTPLSAAGHTHPVFNLAVVGTESAPSLLTASTDGKVAFWSPSQLSQPIEVMQLRRGGGAGGAPGKDTAVTVSSMALGHSEGQEQLVVGSESGGVFTTPMHSRNSGLVQEYSGHYGMVTSVDVNPSSSKVLRELSLSSSVDWTTCLWNLGKSRKPLRSFTHGTYDYVCDAKWSPKHPALFITANISGELGLWNLNQSMEQPLAPPAKVVERAALTRLSWSAEGRRLCVGDSKGVVRAYSLDHDTATARPDEELRLEATLEAKSAVLSD